ncbi:MAG: DNA (cytosine-5-)-methyltransferase [Flavobacteriales bacterium]|nr:DNA (cytosine-5-)-methyltransferase [Flavobacteriales bacterium]
MRFVDLFAGLGGFHVGLERLGHECVFASELDPVLQDIYEKNHGIRPAGDIRKVTWRNVPEHDILCAGFPCQPFSKAGEQAGFDCPTNGSLIDEVLRIIRYRKPEFVVLENVPNLRKHDEGRTWAAIKQELVSMRYAVDEQVYSPHEFGIPQIRQRLLLVARRDSLGAFEWPERPVNPDPQLREILDVRPSEARQLTPQVIDCLNVWQDFLNRIPSDVRLPSFPIWSMEFGATYPFEDRTPYSVSKRALRAYRGSHGMRLDGKDVKDPLEVLPSHARTEEDLFPSWKRSFIRSNRAFYAAHKRELKSWMPEILRFPPSLQKFEWNYKGGERDVWKHVVQFRASGVRVKRADTSPSLVAMTTTQVPIIGWERRYMTTKECARLQSLDSLKHLPATETRAFKALGNAVNARLVEIIAGHLLEEEAVAYVPRTKAPRSAQTAVVA